MPRNPSLEKKHAARLAAVQCLYQHEHLPEATPDELIVARIGMNDEDDATIEEFEGLPATPEPKLLRALVTGGIEQQTEIDRRLAEAMGDRWTGHRMPQLMRALLRAAAFELIYLPATPAHAVLNEYTTVAAAFFDDGETGFVNASVQELARCFRDGQASQSMA